MKTVCIIAPDTVPLPVKSEFLQSLSGEERKEFLHRFCLAEPNGVRSWKFAEILAEKFDVTLLVPDISLPERLKEVVDFSNIKFNIDSYNYRVSSWNWTQELDRKLKKANFVIIQSNSGCGIQNCSILPGTVNLIVDGWNILPQELSGNLLTHSKISRKVFWQKAMLQYKDLITRCNCLLIANDKQRYFYEGFFYGIDKLNYSSFHFSPMLKVPFGVEDIPYFSPKVGSSRTLRLLWYGTIHPWECPEVLIKEFSNYDKISIDFLNIKHQRQPKVFNTYFKTFFDRVPDISNIQISEKDFINIKSLASEYDFGISLSRNWIYETYVHKARALEMLSWGLPVITNETDSIYSEVDFLSTAIEPVNMLDIKKEINSIAEQTSHKAVSAETHSTLKDVFGWNNVLLPVIDYINNF